MERERETQVILRMDVASFNIILLFITSEWTDRRLIRLPSRITRRILTFSVSSHILYDNKTGNRWLGGVIKMSGIHSHGWLSVCRLFIVNFLEIKQFART